MLTKTRGIVFRYTRYGDTSIIVSIFTEMYGLQSYIVNGVRTKTSRGKMAMFQPLTLLDMVVYQKENANIQRIKEVRCVHQYNSLMTDIRKSTQAMFLSEILNKVVRDQTHASEICSFLFDAMEILDRLPGQTENFHLIFLIKLSRFLGFGVQNSSELLTVRMLDRQEEAILDQLLKANFTETIVMTHQQRKNILSLLLHFYATHIENMGEIRSVEVLREILG